MDLYGFYFEDNTLGKANKKIKIIIVALAMFAGTAAVTVQNDKLFVISKNLEIFISVYNNIGLTEFSKRLNHKITVLAGLSGVGKSSLINQLAPENKLRVGEVTGKLGRGRHTTRHVELFEFTNGSLLADTPGFNQPDLDCNPGDLVNYFPEARQRLAEGNCQFNDCLHQDEPNCAVRGDWERYQHYLDFLAEAIARQEKLNDRGDPESTLKAKNKGKGKLNTSRNCKVINIGVLLVALNTKNLRDYIRKRRKNSFKSR